MSACDLPSSTPPASGCERARLEALQLTRLLDTPAEESFDRLTRLAARLLRAPVALVSLVDGRRQFFKSATGLRGERASIRETPRESSFCQHVVMANGPLRVENAHAEELVRDNPAVELLGVVAYLGVPIRTPDGHVIGSLCVNDDRPHAWTAEDLATLEELAEIAMTEIGLRWRVGQQGKSERFARGIVNALSAHICILDGDGIIVEVNRAWREFAEQNPPLASSACVGANYLSVCDAAEDDETAGAFARGIREVLTCERDELALEYPCHSPREKRWFIGRVTRFAGDGPVRLVVAHENITERKLAQERLLRAQRLESIGTLAGGMAHDLNNILTPILMSASLLRGGAAPETCDMALSTIEGNAERAAKIVRQVWSFVHGIAADRVPVDAGGLLREMQKIASETFPRTIEVCCDVAGDLRNVDADPTQLHQMLMNLCVNARDAMPAGGTLRLEAGNAEIDSEYASMTPDARAGRYVVIRVSDTGTGVPRHLVDRIFDPFFTTKPQSEGTGLGLSTVAGIVKTHEGFIEVHTQPGRGTTFAVFLPEKHEQPSPESPVEESRAPRGRGELILVVDDEPAFCEVTEQTLAKHGYRSITACDGAQAVSLFAREAANIHAVLTDVAMPIVDGVALCRALRRINPELRIIAVTGEAGASRLADLQALHVSACLAKPFNTESLLRTLHDALNEPGAAGAKAPPLFP